MLYYSILIDTLVFIIIYIFCGFMRFMYIGKYVCVII